MSQKRKPIQMKILRKKRKVKVNFKKQKNRSKNSKMKNLRIISEELGRENFRLKLKKMKKKVAKLNMKNKL